MINKNYTKNLNKKSIKNKENFLAKVESYKAQDISFEEYVKKVSEEYKDYSKYSLEKEKEYKENIEIVNKETGEVFKLTHNFKKKWKNTSYWYLFVSNHIMSQMINEESDIVAVFVTLTLPSKFHPYKEILELIKYDEKVPKEKIVYRLTPNGIRKFKRTGKYKRNRNYDVDTTFADGYKLLNEGFRSIIKNFKFKSDHVKLKYFRVIEFHKDFTPHLHAVVYVKREHLEKFREHVLRYIKNRGLGEQYKIEVLKNAKAATSYILKYVRKNLFNDDIEYLHLIDGWKRLHKMRMITHSQIEVPRFLFEMVSKNIDLAFGMEKDYDIIQNLLDNVDFTINYFDSNVKSSGKIYKKREHVSKSRKYFVMINVGVTERLKFKDDVDDLDEHFRLKHILDYEEYLFFDFEPDDDEDYNEYEHAERYKVYKIIDFVICKYNDDDTFEKIYDKSDFEIVYDLTEEEEVEHPSCTI